MSLWQKASAVFKDQNSIWLSALSSPSPDAYHNPQIHTVVIRSTSHYRLTFDRRNIDRVCQWIRLSPSNLSPVLRAISSRLSKTRDWVVSLKCLYLIHNIINTNLPCVNKIGRLPFNLSNFNHAHDCLDKSWPFNAFVRAYYAFLDKKSDLIYYQTQGGDHREEGLRHELTVLQMQQALVDLLIQIQPESTAAFVPLILDVMDGIIIDIYDLYSSICQGIAVVLVNIYSGGKIEAKMALQVVRTAKRQGEELSHYFEFCQDLGCFYASDFPVVDRIPEEGIQELERIINSFPDVPIFKPKLKAAEEEKAVTAAAAEEEKRIIVYDNEGKYSYRDALVTIITENWEKFDEDDEFIPANPFGDPYLLEGNEKFELPDFIIF